MTRKQHKYSAFSDKEHAGFADISQVLGIFFEHVNSAFGKCMFYSSFATHSAIATRNSSYTRASTVSSWGHMFLKKKKDLQDI